MNLFAQLSDPLLETMFHALTTYAVIMETKVTGKKIVGGIIVDDPEFIKICMEEIQPLHELLDACDKEYTLRLTKKNG